MEGTRGRRSPNNRVALKPLNAERVGWSQVPSRFSASGSTGSSADTAAWFHGSTGFCLCDCCHRIIWSCSKVTLLQFFGTFLNLQIPIDSVFGHTWPFNVCPLAGPLYVQILYFSKHNAIWNKGLPLLSPSSHWSSISHCCPVWIKQWFSNSFCHDRLWSKKKQNCRWGPRPTAWATLELKEHWLAHDWRLFPSWASLASCLHSGTTSLPWMSFQSVQKHSLWDSSIWTPSQIHRFPSFLMRVASSLAAHINHLISPPGSHSR